MTIFNTIKSKLINKELAAALKLKSVKWMLVRIFVTVFVICGYQGYEIGQARQTIRNVEYRNNNLVDAINQGRVEYLNLCYYIYLRTNNATLRIELINHVKESFDIVEVKDENGYSKELIDFVSRLHNN